MKHRLLTLCLIAIIALATADTFGQGKITRPGKPTTSTSKPKPKTSVKHSAPDGYINTIGYVDLGLPSGILWCYCSLGTKRPTAIGNDYAWGEIDRPWEYDRHSKINKDFSDFSGNPMYDIATLAWKEPWCMPRKEDFEELKKYCKLTYIKNQGYKLTGPNGKSIFFKAYGWEDDKENIIKSTDQCRLWTSTPGHNKETATSVSFFYDSVYGPCMDISNTTNRYFGYGIRPVIRK